MISIDISFSAFVNKIILSKSLNKHKHVLVIQRIGETTFILGQSIINIYILNYVSLHHYLCIKSMNDCTL